MTIRQQVNSYYKFRYADADDPTDLQALLFLLSEVGELVEAWGLDKVEYKSTEHVILQHFIEWGKHADEAASRSGKWVRNNDRTKVPNLADEVADCEQMLDKFAEKCGLPSVEECMLAKWMKKGYLPEVGDENS
jgi:hypothetical protein